ncbi:MAG: glycosyltransferase [Ignavibacteriaceae bacterium]
MNRLGSKFFMAMPFQKRVFNKVAADLSIEPVQSLFELLMGDLTMVTDVPEILSIPEEEMAGWRPSSKKYYRSSTRLQYAGAIFARLFGNIPEDVRSFLDIDKPKIYVAMASGKKENLQRVYDTLSMVMPLCDLAIIHGGQGSVQTAISSGTPLIGFPIQPEQNFNLKQVERHGAGLCLSLRSLRKGRLRESINQILIDDRYKKSMRQLLTWQSSRDGALEVAKAVSELLNN